MQLGRTPNSAEHPRIRNSNAWETHAGPAATVQYPTSVRLLTISTIALRMPLVRSSNNLKQPYVGADVEDDKWFLRDLYFCGGVGGIDRRHNGESSGGRTKMLHVLILYKSHEIHDR